MNELTDKKLHKLLKGLSIDEKSKLVYILHNHDFVIPNWYYREHVEEMTGREFDDQEEWEDFLSFINNEISDDITEWAFDYINDVSSEWEKRKEEDVMNDDNL